MLDRSPHFWGKSKPRRWLARGQRPSRDSIIPTVSSPLSPPRAPAGLLWWEVFPNKERIKHFLSTPEEKQTPTALRSPAKNDGFLLLLLLKSLPGEIDQGTFCQRESSPCHRGEGYTPPPRRVACLVAVCTIIPRTPSCSSPQIPGWGQDGTRRGPRLVAPDAREVTRPRLQGGGQASTLSLLSPRLYPYFPAFCVYLWGGARRVNQSNFQSDLCFLYRGRQRRSGWLPHVKRTQKALCMADHSSVFQRSPLKGREEKSTVKSCEKCYIRHPRYAGHSKGSDKSRKEETGSPLFLLGFVKRM